MSAILQKKNSGTRHPILAATILFGAWIILLELLSVVVNPLLVSGLSNNSAWLRFTLELESLVSIVVVVLIGIKFFGNANQKNSIKCVFLTFFVGLVSGVVWFILSFGLLNLVGVIDLGGVHNSSLLFVWLSACFINAAFQEVLVRSYMFDLLLKGKGAVFATVVTTVLFVLFHPGAFMAGPIAVLQIAAASIFLTLLRLVTHGISAPIAAHAVWNMLGGVVFGVVSLADDYPSVFDAQIAGPWFISGGLMELEGSLITLLVTCGLCAFMLVLAHRVRSN